MNLYTDLNNNRYLSSCVGVFIPLIDYLPKKDYDYLKSIWKNNGHQLK